MKTLILGRSLPANDQKGFTIIEVVLVLAIAGLIFLTVFLALPAMQKSQRDTARRQDVGRAIAALQKYWADNGTRPPGGTQPANSEYFSNFGQATTVYIRTTDACQAVPTGSTYEGWLIISPGCSCAQSIAATGSGITNAKYGSAGIILEATNRMYCRDY